MSYELLQEAPQTGIHTGENGVWQLIADGQYYLLAQLLDHNLITLELLAQTAHGRNSVCLLALAKDETGFDRPIQILRTLLSRRLLTQELLAQSVQIEFLKEKVNVIGILLFFQRFDFLTELVDADLLTSDLLIKYPEESGSIINYLMLYKQSVLLQKMYDKHLLKLEEDTFAEKAKNQDNISERSFPSKRMRLDDSDYTSKPSQLGIFHREQREQNLDEEQEPTAPYSPPKH